MTLASRRPSGRSLGRPAATLGVASLAVLGLTAPAGATVIGDEVTLDILGITDFHGALEQAPHIAGQVAAVRAANPDSVFVSAGDNIGGSTYASAIQQDQPTIDVLNAMGLEASAVGNHEFDQGYADLSGRVVPEAGWTYLGANVEGETPELAPYHVWTSPSGVTVGFIGTVTTETPTIVAADGIAGLTFEDEAVTTNAVAAQLTDGDGANGEADVVVALAHTGATPTFLNALDETRVDAVFTGHSHAEVSQATPIAVIQGGSSGAFLSQMTITYNTTTDAVTSAVGTNTPVDDSLPADAEVQAIVDAALAEADVLGQEVVGTVDGPLNHGSNTGAADGSNRGTESPLGNLLGDVAKWTVERSSAKEPDFGIINPGGVRAPLDADNDGEITYAEAFATQPFGNTVGTVDLTGAQVLTLLEQQFQDPTDSRPVLRLGLSKEVRYVYDPTAERGSMITKAFIGGEPVDPAATYTVASNTFLLGGQDGFTVLAEGTGLTETGVVDLQGLVDYLAAHPELAADYSQRSIGITPQAAPVAGEEVTVDLASLGFTTTEPKPVEVAVSYAGQVLATTTEIDHTITAKSDETGRAAVSFVVPAGFTGVGDLEVAITLDGQQQPEEPAEPSVPADVPWGFFLNDSWTAKANHVFTYGKPSDAVLTGDWDGDGKDTITVRRGNVFYVSNAPRGGVADHVFTYGKPGDTILVGDWDGDGKDTLAVRRGAQYHVKNTLTGGKADQVVTYGRAGDQVVVGDWDGNGKDTFAVRRASTYYVKNTISGGNADQVVAYGKPTDITLAGDWDGDGKDTFAVRRASTYYVKNTISGGKADFELAYGRPGDEVHVGDWNGDTKDTLGVRRLP